MIELDVSEDIFYTHNRNKKISKKSIELKEKHLLYLPNDIQEKLNADKYPNIIGSLNKSSYVESPLSNTVIQSLYRACIMIYFIHEKYDQKRSLLCWIVTDSYEKKEDCLNDAIQQITSLVQCESHEFDQSLIGDHPRKKDAIGRCIHCQALAIDHYRVFDFDVA